MSAAVFFFYDFKSARMIFNSQGSSNGEGAASFDGRINSLSPSWKMAVVAKIAWLGVPIGVVMGLNTLIQNIPRYFVVNHLGESGLGIFAAMFYLTIVGSQFIGAICDSVSPRLARLFADGDYVVFRTVIAKLTLVALLLGGAGLLVAIVAGKPILSMIYRPEYARNISTLAWLMASSGPLFVATVLGYAVLAMRYFHAQVPFRIIHLIAVYALCSFLIPKYGLDGAGKAIFFSSVFFALLMGVLVFICGKHAGIRSTAILSTQPAVEGRNA
jgi:O-antigen/teichoic acid export membrane protein